MTKTRHKLGVMDLYPIAVNKTKIENNPFFQVRLKEPVDVHTFEQANLRLTF